MIGGLWRNENRKRWDLIRKREYLPRVYVRLIHWLQQSVIHTVHLDSTREIRKKREERVVREKTQERRDSSKREATRRRER